MKLNKKGFTLIELLAVIVLLIVISAIAIPNITASIERSKNKQYEAKLEVILEAAKLYYTEHKKSLTTAGFMNRGCYIPVSVLELTDKEKENPKGGTFANGKIIYDNNQYTYYETEQLSGINACS